MLDESEMMIPAQGEGGPSVFHPLLRILLFLMSAWSPSTASPETSQYDAASAVAYQSWNP